MSTFYNQQSAEGKNHIEDIIKKSVEEAVFGFFAYWTERAQSKAQKTKVLCRSSTKETSP
ncbi:hypothetical protein BKM20_06175 [Pseudomonas avellanae]|uniref:Uncharacterized protein n=2 Tax=Pseudomonas TaxID=286 RepID=A0ABX4Z2B7_9PSED|nr:hypothetical protein AL055_15395 [Pseudomonas amygdali pv. morsprunorum]PHN40373.1 hypothetical protein AO261_15305 [Pseudomonas avellanae]POC96942.1 hypothetical protein BKM26_04885 [Pseudomonas avellanae]POD10642.1 hypothetical protein BKM20_06175 [Pseudomonas avellanae]POD28964.1 hypothetical protein BKM05_06380 [Pseudomonas avellanae]